MPVNSFSVGRDLSLTCMINGLPTTFTGLTEFSADPVVTQLKSKRIDGTPQFGIIPDGWKGSFKVDRMDNTVDTLWATIEANYFAGTNLQAGTILETIQEANGTVSQWRYDGVIIQLEKAGDWGGDKKVEQTVSFNAAHKLRIA